MPSFRFWLLLGALALASTGNALSAPSHCTREEEVYFNCLVEGSRKVGSVCGAGYDFSKNQAGYLQYRFGYEGETEFKYPQGISTGEMMDRFNFSAGRTADYVQWDSALEFRNGEYSYSVYAGEEHLANKKKRYSASITVWKGNDRKHARVLKCSNPDAGKNLKVDHIVRMMSSPGRKWSESLW